MHLHKKWGESRILTTSGVEVFAKTVDGSYSLTVAMGTSFRVVVGLHFPLGRFVLPFFIYFNYLYHFFLSVCVYFNNGNLNNWFMQLFFLLLLLVVFSCCCKKVLKGKKLLKKKKLWLAKGMSFSFSYTTQEKNYRALQNLHKKKTC